MNKKYFYDRVRPVFFGGKLTAGTVKGCEAILDECNELSLDDRKTAYVLATAYHETAHTLQPVTEKGPKSYFDKYEPGTKLGKRLGNIIKGDGYLYRGHGFVQLTGRYNFKEVGDDLDLPLVQHPELALQYGPAAKILVIGMHRGWFTGKRLADYINPTKTDFKGARRIVNGVDKAALIAEYTYKFLSAISH